METGSKFITLTLLIGLTVSYTNAQRTTDAPTPPAGVALNVPTEPGIGLPKGPRPGPGRPGLDSPRPDDQPGNK